MKKKITVIQKKIKEYGIRIIEVLILIIFICSVGYIGFHLYERKNEQNELKELQQRTIENLEEEVDIVDEELENENEDEETETEDTEKKILYQYEEMYSENQDLIGWIKIEDTPIDYPVMQTIDEPNFYIHRDWDKNQSKNGLPYVDSRCILGSGNAIIYGHNMKSGAMFGTLKNYKDENFFKEHQIIEFDTIYEEAEYQIIGVALAKVFYVGETDLVSNDVPEGEFVFYDYVDLETEEIFEEYVEKIKELSIYDTGVTAEYGDSLITLCTCSYHVQDGRLLVVAKKIQ